MPPLPHPDADLQQQGAGKAAFRMPETLRKRADFLAAAKGRRQGMPGFLLQALPRAEGADLPPRIGYTCSKKLGNAVMRNRAKRRLRALAREVLPARARAGWDYVLVGRPDATVSRDFATLRSESIAAMDKVHRS